MSDIVERLRLDAAWAKDEPRPDSDDMLEAADAIEALELELEVLRPKRDEWDKYVNELMDERDSYKAALEAQAAEIEGLRGRLRLGSYINGAHIGAADMPHTVVEKLQAAIDVALATPLSVMNPVDSPQEPLATGRMLADGFGSIWFKCEREDCDLQIVRPGKVQCGHCDRHEIRPSLRL